VLKNTASSSARCLSAHDLSECLFGQKRSKKIHLKKPSQRCTALKCKQQKLKNRIKYFALFSSIAHTSHKTCAPAKRNIVPQTKMPFLCNGHICGTILRLAGADILCCEVHAMLEKLQNILFDFCAFVVCSLIQYIVGLVHLNECFLGPKTAKKTFVQIKQANDVLH